MLCMTLYVCFTMIVYTFNVIVFPSALVPEPLCVTPGMVMCLIERYMAYVTTRFRFRLYASLCVTFECCMIYGFSYILCIYSGYEINDYSRIRLWIPSYYKNIGSASRVEQKDKGKTVDHDWGFCRDPLIMLFSHDLSSMLLGVN